MTQSMTGFATSTVLLPTPSNERVVVTLTIKSLNSRFFDASCRLPHLFSSYETDFIKLFKSKLGRGQIYFTINISDPEAFSVGITASKATLKGYIDAIDKLKKEFNIPGEVSIENLFDIPHLFTSLEGDIPEAIKNQLFAGIDDLVEKLIVARNNEGKQLQDDLLARIKSMTIEIARLEETYKKNFTSKQEEIQEKFNAIKSSVEDLAEHQRAILYQLLDKMDLHEEIERFKAHLTTLHNIISGTTNEQGKKLDFTLQELSREVTTIASKCAHAEISNSAIAIKVELEKCREQAQNIV
jgi:uncharacterized protein (TIGR00255 family)